MEILDKLELYWLLFDAGDALQITQILGLVFLGNAVLRFIYTHIALHFGFWHPAQDANFPRLPWRPFWHVLFWLREWLEERFKHGKGGSAAWTSVFSALAMKYRPGDVLLGRVWTWFGGWIQPMGLSGVQRHLMLIAGAGSGKSVFMISMLALLKKTQSAFVIDPKGQIAKVLVPSLRKLGRVIHVLDPLSVTPFQTASWNYLAEIPVINERLGQDVTTLFLDKVANADIEKNPKENPFWPDSARILWGSVLAYVYKTYPASERNPITARNLINRGLTEHAESHDEALALLWICMKNCPDLDGYISKGGSMMAGADERTANNILASVRSGTAYLDHPQVKRVCKSNTFNVTDLKGGADFLILVSPTTEIRGTLLPWFRVMTMTTLWVFEQIPGSLKDPTLFAIDELPALGHIEEIQQAAPVMRGYGVRLLGIAQDLEALKRAYPDGWGGLLGNSECTYFMGIGPGITANYIEAELGKSLRVETTGRGDKKREFFSERELMTADQVQRFLSPRKTNMIVLRFGERPLKAKQMPSYRFLPVWLQSPDAEHGEPAARAWFRSLLDRSPATKPKAMPERDARALFGLAGSFTRRDLKTRSELLNGKFPADLVASAFCTLEGLL